MRHWQTQNWLGVALDLLVVIAGILIGLRIDAWRDNVQDREDEVGYLERLLDEAEANHHALDEVLERMWYRREQGRNALERLLSGEPLATDERARTVDALVHAGELPKPAIVNGTYEELISTGRMPIVQDQELRILLTRQIAVHGQVAAQADTYRAALLEAQPLSDRHAILSGEATAEGVELGKAYDLASLRTDNQALVTFFNQIEASEDFSAQREAEREAVAAVRDRLRCSLRRASCSDRASGLEDARQGAAL